MHHFEDDLTAFRDWWATGGRKTRRDSTVTEYIRHLRNWHRWTESQPDGPLSVPTVRSVRAYVRHVRPRSEWTAVEAVRALKTYTKWLVIDHAVGVCEA